MAEHLSIGELPVCYPSKDVCRCTRLDLHPLIAEIEAVMSAYIPEFGRKFSVDFTATAIDEVREEKTFAIRTARALVFGETGVGKTTTINYLLNSPIFPVSGRRPGRNNIWRRRCFRRSDCY